MNILVNILLLGSKGAAVLLSNSMSLLASFVDSALDFLSTLIIWGADFAAKREDRGTKYPTGKKRFEPLGVLIFSVCMIASFSQVLVESLKKLFGEESDVGTVSLFGKAFVFRLSHESPVVDILSQYYGRHYCNQGLVSRSPYAISFNMHC